MIEARARIERSRELSAPIDQAWALLQDIPAWGALFPNVETIEPHAEPDAFVWTMQPLGPPGSKVQTVYGCRYHADGGRHTLSWTPIEGVGTGTFAGRCALSATASGGTRGQLAMDATLRIPAPRFMRGVVEPLVQVEMGRMTDTFLKRLDAALGA